MNPLFLSPSKLLQTRLLSVFSLTSLLLTLLFVCQIGQAQQTQLSLADILIGLRSKKATLPERNKLLSDAVKVRGITFTASTEIETELQNTGASVELLEVIRQRSSKTDAAPNIKSGVPVMAASFVPASTPAKPAAPDFAFYQKRAYENVVKGEFDLAVSDYNEAVKLNPKEVSLFINRGRAHQSKKSYDLAIADFNTAIELNPKEATAYFNRGDSHEKKGNAQQAMNDYQKVLELDANNESAKINLKRLQAEQLKAEQAKAEQLKAEQLKVEQAKMEQLKMQEAAAAAAKTKVPESVELGQLNALAVKLATPVYPATAQTMNIQGKVTVQISLDEEGKVVSAKAVNGHQFLRAAGEDAARRSKFKPTLVGTQAVKATGFIVYNFLGK